MADDRQQSAARRARLTGSERRQSILVSAKRVFARLPYGEASIGELARASDVTEPMLYKHFGSKKGLFLSVLGESSRLALAAFRERLSRRADVNIPDALRHVVDDYRATVQQDPETQRILFQAVTESHDPEIARRIREHNRRVYDTVYQLVERAQEHGDLDPTVTPAGAAWGYMSMVLALQYGLMLNLSHAIAPMEAEAGAIWLRGMTPRRP